MRLLGTKSPLAAFRWDLLYLIAQLVSDDRPGVAILASPLQALLVQLDIERSAHEQAEGAVIVAGALLAKRDQRRDKALIEVGGIARVTDEDVYKVLFPRLSPAVTARLSIDEESVEVARILGELATLPPEHLLRTHYEQELTATEALVKSAGAGSDAAITAFALQRSQLERFKLKIDQQRLTTHGELLVLLKSKAEVDAFYRPTTTPPDAPAAKGPQAQATAQAPSAATIAGK